MMSKFVLTLSCPDALGIVAAVSQALANAQMNIEESHQYGDPDSGQFFMRVGIGAQSTDSKQVFESAFETVASKFNMQWHLYDASVKPRTLILVSKFDHCMVDLIYRCQRGSLHMDIAAVASNHEIGRDWSENAGIAYHYWPGGKEAKAENEAKLKALIEAENIELIILARYMQILSPDLTAAYSGQIINIHHSFLPSFKGAEPYSRAHARGVKLIGATAHFVTADLDEGPIISQGIEAIRHDMNVEEVIDVGRDVERRTLATAVRLYTERRVLLNGLKTVVFD
jgi:formyltetrahydrofolate deformylase